MEVALDLVTRIDDIGKPAWIALMIAGFILFWPVGLAILGFLLWSGRMGMGCGHRGPHWRHKGWRRYGEERPRWGGPRSSGNLAFDEYRMETLRRLEDEQREFVDFLQKLRHAKDKAEFDQFMAERRDRPPEPDDQARPVPGERG
jgi:hypothetical protein